MRNSNEEPTILKKSNENLKHVHHRCSCFNSDFVHPCQYQLQKEARNKARKAALFFSGLAKAIISGFAKGIIEFIESKK